MIAWLPVLRWLGIVAAVAAVLWFGAVSPRLDLAAERAAHAETRAGHAAVITELAAKARHAADLARAASERVKADRAAVDAEHKEALDNATREADRLRDCLRTGTCELQDRWACRVPGAGEGGAAADAGEADTEGRIDGAARIVQAADTDAAVIQWLWAGWTADRQAVIDAGCAVVGD